MVEFQEIKYEMNYHKSCKYIIYSCCFSCSVMSNSFATHGHGPSGSSVHGISQAATREGAATPFSNITYVCLSVSCVGLSETPWTVAPPGSSVHGILQARILEWVAMSSPREPSQPRDQILLSRIASRLFTI